MSASPEFIHRFVPGKSNRTLLLLHGTGGDEEDLLPIGRAIDPDAALLSPRGKVLENGMPRFFRRIAEGVFDLEDLHQRANELADFVVAAAVTYRLDATHVVGIGYSNGANIAGAMLLLRPRVLCAAALLRAMIPLIPENLPALDGKPVLIASGLRDSIVPAEHPRALAELLRRSGANVTVLMEEAGHSLTEVAIESTRQWLSTLPG